MLGKTWQRYQKGIQNVGKIINYRLQQQQQQLSSAACEDLLPYHRTIELFFPVDIIFRQLLAGVVRTRVQPRFFSCCHDNKSTPRIVQPISRQDPSSPTWYINAKTKYTKYPRIRAPVNDKITFCLYT